ncbi:pentapeptide repeat-containing protein, partial [Mesorhizobium sp. M2D.F.Ca.ET.223.01.1.1]|uniref:pentapeptide repeat-containing protein n=1 Tax=Mesorhizobium sp. M2D.F.Ca.ET.223.01.1.1 TaxID=2563940 RepID=UPI001091AF60
QANDEKSTSPAITILRALAALAVESSQKSKNSDGAIPADVSTALGIIGSGIKEIESNQGLGTLWPSLDLREGRFAGSVVVLRDLSHTDFRHADLRGSDFFKTKFYESNLRFAQMQGVNGSGADFSHAGLSNASFQRGVNWAVPAMETGDLIGSQLSGSTFYNVSGENIKFDGACLAGAVFNNADIKVSTFDKADLFGAQFKAARLSGLPDNNLSFARTNLMEAKFTPDGSNAVLTDVSFESADLRKADLSGAILTNVDFHRANLTDAHFEGAVLSNVHFDDGVLAKAIFKDAKLSGTSFKGALIQGAVFNGTTLDGADMTSLCGSALPDDRIAIGYCEAPPPNPPPVNPVDPHSCL